VEPEPKKDPKPAELGNLARVGAGAGANFQSAELEYGAFFGSGQSL